MATVQKTTPTLITPLKQRPASFAPYYHSRITTLPNPPSQDMHPKRLHFQSVNPLSLISMLKTDVLQIVHNIVLTPALSYMYP